MSRLRLVASIAWRKPSSSKEFIEVRSIGSTSGISAWIVGSVGPLKPMSTPIVDSTIGTSNALAVLASQRA